MRKQMTKLLLPGISAFLLVACATGEEQKTEATETEVTAQEPEQKELKVWQVPNIGQAAEAYFSPDGKSIICNAKHAEDDSAHHVYTLNIDGTDILRINNKGEDACSFYFPDGEKLVFTSTRDRLDLPKGNWSKSSDYPQGAELYSCNLDGSDVKRLTDNEYYDAEISVSPDGEWILFSRQTEGNLDLWKMRADGSEESQITDTPDWQEGGSFYMSDSKTILLRAWKTGDEGRGKPMTIFTIKDDGTELTQITKDTLTNWAPYPAPDGAHFVFAKILPPHNFEIFLMNIITGEQTRLTYNDAFDGFPALSPDGKMLTFSSGRDAKGDGWELYQYLMDISSLNLGMK